MERIRITKVLPTYQVAKIQRLFNDYHCEIVELGIMTLQTARVTLEGKQSDIDELLTATNYDVEE